MVASDLFAARGEADRYSLPIGPRTWPPWPTAASLLSPVLVILFYAIAKLIALVIGPWLVRGRPAWPFMPVVSLATLVILAFGWWW